MTLIELGIVMGIASVLLALVLGLARHVDASIKIRRAQADLGEWHETLDRWFIQFGEYPHARIDMTGAEVPTDILASPSATINGTTYSDARAILTVLTNRCAVVFASKTNVAFRAFLTTDVSTVDPWNIPYVYVPSDNGKTYTLFSCGPDRKSINLPSGSDQETALDDIHFER